MISYIFIIKKECKLLDLIALLTQVKREAVWIGVSSIPECENELRYTLDECGVKYNLVVNAEDFSDYYKIDQFIPSLKNGWTYVHEVGQSFRTDVHSKVKKFIESGGKFGLIADDHEATTDICFYNLIYKMLRGNKPELDQMINFYDKVEREDESMVKKWEEISGIHND